MGKPHSERHYLSDIDEEGRVATCLQCGPSTPIHRHGSTSTGWVCQATKSRSLPGARTDYRRRTKYGLTSEQWEEKFEAQGRVCAICRTDEPGTKGWSTDHDRWCCPDVNTCGECVRDILCARCNVGLGMFRDSIEALEAAVAYIRRHIELRENRTKESP